MVTISGTLKQWEALGFIMWQLKIHDFKELNQFAAEIKANGTQDFINKAFVIYNSEDYLNIK